MSLTLTIPGRPMTSNDRAHWRPRARQTAALRRDAYERALEAWGPVRRIPTLRFPVAIVVADLCRTANLRDVCSCAPAAKAVIDGLVDFGILPDDSPEYVSSTTYLQPVKAGRDELVFTISEVS